ncbi:MAG: hypothetical protein HOV80_19260 [Polyangiaceae bacterium]|nr:hypothetical protein [Polyangiaceae bacterium]
MRPGDIVPLLLLFAGCAPAPSPIEAGREETASSSHRETAPEPSGPPDGFRECFAQPLELEPPYGEKPLPPGVASWIAEIDAAMPRVVARDKEPVVVVPLIAGEAQRAEVPVGEARYGAARTLFEHQHWGAAAQRFRDIAMSDATDIGIYAAQLYLECLNLVAMQSKPNRPRCFDAVRTDTSRFIGIYCAPATRAKSLEQCDVLEKIERDLSLRAR